MSAMEAFSLAANITFTLLVLVVALAYASAFDLHGKLLRRVVWRVLALSPAFRRGRVAVLERRLELLLASPNPCVRAALGHRGVNAFRRVQAVMESPDRLWMLRYGDVKEFHSRVKAYIHALEADKGGRRA